MKTNKYTTYEAEKAKIQTLNITHEEYERRVRELAKRLRI